MQITDLIIPLLFAGIMIWGAVRRVDVFRCFCDGASGGLRTTAEILPALVLLVISVGMLRASGAVDLLTGLLEPLCSAVGFPPECMQMVLLRPFSGSGAMAVYDSIAWEYGADSLPERTAAILLGSSETTFYTIAVYFSAVKVRRTRYAVPAAMTADLTAWIVCALIAGLFF